MNEGLLSDTKAIAELKEKMATIESESERDRQLRAKNEAIGILAKVCMTLDRLQVELSDNSPYEVPGTEEIRKRILSTFDGLQAIEKFVSGLMVED